MYALKIIEISSSLAATVWAGVVVPDILHGFLMRSLDEELRKLLL